MPSLLRVFTAGTVMFFMTVPFSFAQQVGSPVVTVKLIQHHSALKENGTYNFSSRYFADSTIGIAKDTTFTTKNVSDKKFRMKKQPWKAILYSALLPGGGQFYNQSYWKIPVILGLCGYFGYEYWNQDKKFRDYRDQYTASQTTANPDGDPSLKTLREFYRNQRDDFTWYFIIAYVVNLVDAYVDAHLFDFDVKDEKLSNGNWDRKATLKLHVNF